jgi:SAM-dependent methyltransferase
MKKLGEDQHRTWEQIKEHYSIEKELASRLRNASRGERRRLYSSLYDELYRRVSHHPRNTRRLSAEDNARAVRNQMWLLQRFLFKEAVFLEVGPGDCSLSFEAAKFVKKVYGVEVSAVAAQRPACPQNFELLIFDGCNIPLAANSVNVVYSNSVMEHLHQDDALEQLQSIYNVLAPGGMYLCITPNRLYGPTDISKYFDSVPTGFHMREYTTGELGRLMRKVGFRWLSAYVGGRGMYLKSPLAPVLLCEAGLKTLPMALRKALSRTMLFRGFIGVRLVAAK